MPSPTTARAANYANGETAMAMAASSPHSLASGRSDDLLSQSSSVKSKPTAVAPPHICRKSYAATASRPSESPPRGSDSDSAECRGARKHDRKRTTTNAALVESNAALAGEDPDGSEKIPVKVSVHASADGRGERRGVMFRTYNKGYAKKPSERPRARRRRSRLARKLERGWGRPDELKGNGDGKDGDRKGSGGNGQSSHDDSKNEDDGSSSSSSSSPLEDLDPSKFRASYESKNVHSKKNLENIKAIAQAKEDALHISLMVEVPDGEEEEGVQFSPLTCPASQPALGQERAIDEEDGDADEGGRGGDDAANGRQQLKDDASDDNVQHAHYSELNSSGRLIIKGRPGKEAGSRVEELERTLTKRSPERQPEKEKGSCVEYLERVSAEQGRVEMQKEGEMKQQADGESSEDDDALDEDWGCQGSNPFSVEDVAEAEAEERKSRQPEKEARWCVEELKRAQMKGGRDAKQQGGDIKQQTGCDSSEDDGARKDDFDWRHRGNDQFRVEEEEDEEGKPPAKRAPSNDTASGKTGEAPAPALAAEHPETEQMDPYSNKNVEKMADQSESCEDDVGLEDDWEHHADDRHSEEEEDKDDNEEEEEDEVDPFAFKEKKPPVEPPSPSKGSMPNPAQRRAIRSRRGVTALALAAEHERPRKAGAPDISGRKKAAKKRPARKRKGATALALATEYEEPEEKVADKNDEENRRRPDAARTRGRKRKQGPTALALAEYEETGTVDSYFAKRVAERKGKKALEEWQEEAGEMDAPGEDEDHGHASFHCDDEELGGVEKQSDPSSAAEKQSEPLLSSLAPEQSAAVARSSSKSFSSKAEMEQQSEPLLSSAQIELLTAARAEAAAAESTTDTTNNNNNEGTLTASEMIVALRNEVDEMGRALLCPICQSTLSVAKILPCVHAFCSGCLKDYFNPKPTRDPKSGRRRPSPCKAKNECPVCKAPNRGQRSGVLAPHIDELVRAYKGIGRAFGFAPVVYGANIVMTQLDPEETGGHAMDSEEGEDENRKMHAQDETDVVAPKRKSDAHEYGQHLQVCRTVHGAFLERTESLQRLQESDRPVDRQEEIENRNQVRRLQLLAKEQEAVVAVDERAFDRARRMGGAKEMLAAKTAKFLAEAAMGKAVAPEAAKGKVFDKLETAYNPSGRTSASENNPEKTETSSEKKEEAEESTGKVALASRETARGKLQPNTKNDLAPDACDHVADKQSEGKMSAEASEQIDSDIMDNNGSLPSAINEAEQTKTTMDGSSSEEEDEFCTAPDESQYSTAPEENEGTESLNVTTVPSPTVIHDGNTVKKAPRPKETSRAPSNSSDSQRSMPHSYVFDEDQSPLSLEKTAARLKEPLRAMSAGGSSQRSKRDTCVFDVEQSPLSLHKASAARGSHARESTITAATAHTDGSPIVLHDGNTTRKIRRNGGPKQPTTVARSLLGEEVKSDSLEDLNNVSMTRGRGRKKPSPKVSLDHDPTPRRSGKMSLLPTAAVAVTAANEDETAASLDRGVSRNRETVAEEDREQTINKGTIVSVQSRTWPGINKPGGVARVTKVHPAANNGYSTKYDVSYILGGKEKQVDESFVTLHEVDALETIQEESPISARVSTSPPKKSRSVRHRKAAVAMAMTITRTEQPNSQPGGVNVPNPPIYRDEELKHIPADVLKWAGIVPKVKKGKSKAAAGGLKKDASATRRGKKRVLTESNANPKSKPAKKKTKLQTATTTTPAKKQVGVKSPEQVHPLPAAVKGLRGVVSQLSDEECVTMADARYCSILSLNMKLSQADTLTLHAVTSSLSDEDSRLLDSLCKMLKGKNVIIKIARDFNPNKTQLCITAPDSSPKTSFTLRRKVSSIDVVSKSRTLKVMRSALAGIPIVTTQWMEACLKEGRMVAPSGSMCIRTLPRKQAAKMNSAEAATEHFGVARYAAAFHETSFLSSSHLFGGFSVMLCGSSAGPGMRKDLKVLLQQAGASIISSVSMASRVLMDMSKDGGESSRPFVLLCDGSSTDKSCGISDALFKQVKRLVGDSRSSEETEEAPVLCVHFNWLFDSISCATPMKAADYAPLAPRSRVLWDFITSKETPTSASNGEKSQIY